MKNSIFAIETYRHGAAWVFDDPSVGLVKEPFVAGADTLIDRICGGKDRVTLVFSELRFPSAKLTLTKVGGGPSTGTDYVCEEMGRAELWLCPALNLYFPESPVTIYVDFK
jgi:hypothetical protein